VKPCDWIGLRARDVYGGGREMVSESDSIDALRQIEAELDKYGIEFWLDCGALLGSVEPVRQTTLLIQ